MKKLLRMFGVALAFLGVFSTAQAVTIGGPGASGNCIPFGCNFGTGTRYQQVYDDAAFGGPITITGINFFGAGGGGDLNTGTYTLSLSHSVNPVDALSTTFDANVGADDTLFGVFVLGGPAPATLSFTGGPFVYDGVGDLLLDMHIALTDQGGASYNALNNNANGVFSRMHNFGSAFANFGLITEFVGDAVVPPGVPEPMSLALLGLGLAGLGFSRRRKA